jgi:hypothetical protein
MPGKFIKKMSKKAVVTVTPEPSSQTPTVPVVVVPEPAKVAPTAVQLSPLEPLDITKKAPKKKRGKISRSNLKKKRENKHAVLIQSKWRGHCTRKTISERKEEKEKAHLQEPDEDNAEEEKLEAFKQIPFDDIKRVQFCVDNAVGLPVNCTVTRISCRLLQQDRTPLSEAGESFSDPESPVTSPEYDMFMTWKGKFLFPYCCRYQCRICTYI